MSNKNSTRSRRRHGGARRRRCRLRHYFIYFVDDSGDDTRHCPYRAADARPCAYTSRPIEPMMRTAAAGAGAGRKNAGAGPTFQLFQRAPSRASGRPRFELILFWRARRRRRYTHEDAAAAEACARPAGSKTLARYFARRCTPNYFSCSGQIIGRGQAAQNTPGVRARRARRCTQAACCVAPSISRHAAVAAGISQYDAAP